MYVFANGEIELCVRECWPYSVLGFVVSR